MSICRKLVRIKYEYRERLCVNKLGKWIGQFLAIQKTTKTGSGRNRKSKKMYNLKKKKEIELVIKKMTHQEKPSPDGFSCELYYLKKS